MAASELSSREVSYRMKYGYQGLEVWKHESQLLVYKLTKKGAASHLAGSNHFGVLGDK